MENLNNANVSVICDNGTKFYLKRSLIPRFPKIQSFVEANSFGQLEAIEIKGVSEKSIEKILQWVEYYGVSNLLASFTKVQLHVIRS